MTFTYLSCTRQSQSEQKELSKLSINKKLTVDSPSLTIGTFNKIPDDIDGCGCYFYLSKEDELKSNYLFINDFADVAFISINQKLVRLQLEAHVESSDVYSYKSEDYTVKLEIQKRVEGGEEVSIVEGTIRVSDAKHENQKKIVGTCGC
ncbi:MAG: hypothetical protein V4616_00885 [Bacteroidota bacterium]